MSKRPPELTWQDKAILVVIPFVVIAIFVVANYLNKDLTVSEAFSQRIPKTVILDSGYITELLPPDTVATAAQRCRLKSRDGDQSFVFHYNIQGSQTMNLAIGRLVQFFGEYRYDPQGGIVEVPYKGKSGRLSGWAVYENHRYFATSSDENGDL